MQSVLNASIKMAGNGELTYGFVASSDKGLAESEFVRIPNTILPGPFVESNKVPHDNKVKHSQVIICDAERVNGFQIHDSLKGFVLAGRASQVLYGVLGEEYVHVPLPTDEEANRWMTVPFVKQALSLGPDIATLPHYITTVNYYQTNHNTGGSVLQKGYIRAIRSSLGLALPDEGGPSEAEITRAVYLAGHSADKRLTLRSFLASDAPLKTPTVLSTFVKGKHDQWAATRRVLKPAGTHVLSTLGVLLEKVTRYGLAGLKPVPDAIDTLAAGIMEYKHNPWIFHPGAEYLFTGITNPVTLSGLADLKTYVGIFASMMREAGQCASVLSAAHVRELARQHNLPEWDAIGRKIAAGAQADIPTAEAALKAVGVTSAESFPDPAKQPSAYHTKADEAKLRVLGFNALLGQIGAAEAALSTVPQVPPRITAGAGPTDIGGRGPGPTGGAGAASAVIGSSAPVPPRAPPRERPATPEGMIRRSPSETMAKDWAPGMTEGIAEEVAAWSDTQFYTVYYTMANQAMAVPSGYIARPEMGWSRARTLFAHPDAIYYVGPTITVGEGETAVVCTLASVNMIMERTD